MKKPTSASSLDLARLNNRFKNAKPDKILKWLIKKTDLRLAVSTSFQSSGTVLLYFLRKIDPDFPIYFINTGFHFPETLEFNARLTKKWDLNVITINPKISKKALKKKYGSLLYETDPDLCCQINKVQPFNTLKQQIKADGWISALRRDQSPSRADFEMFMSDQAGTLRVHPLIYWTKERLWAYLIKHDLPYHPLYDQGYTSIGCFPYTCTSKSTTEDDDRSGRWAGREKTECGLHQNLNRERNTNLHKEDGSHGKQEK